MEFLVFLWIALIVVVNVKGLQQSSTRSFQQQPLSMSSPQTTSSITSTVDGFPVEKIDVPLLTKETGKELHFYQIREWQRESSAETTSQQNQEFESKAEHAGLTQLGFSFDPHADPRRRIYVKETFTYGGKLWPSGLAIALNLCKDRHLIADKIVLDVGCGVGLTAITSATLGAKQTIAVDISPLTLKLLEYSARSLQLSDRIQTQLFDLFDTTQPLPPADVVVFADLLYNKPLGKGTARRVYEAYQRGSWVIVGSQKGREGREAFTRELRELGIENTFMASEKDDMQIEANACGRDEGQVGVELLELHRPLH